MNSELKRLIREKIMNEEMNIEDTIEYIWSLKEDDK